MSTRASTADRIFFGLFVLFAVLRVYEYATDGQQLSDALGAAGFALMAYGTWNRAFATLTEANLANRRTQAQIGTYGGVALVLASFALRYLG
ncbi:MAG: hypothetical protein Q4G62_11220 [Pseudomonadota bacterium]|nr:hypothetical protein [Pseudomonadota bacterium]